ncbi:MAG: hypothetical protein IPM74_15170 [Crocinitomicaceae bacterium]|nr:hypothetical protein [Crocinitomicaceae bacterium]
MSRTFLISIFILTCTAHAQMLDNSRLHAFEGKPEFNRTFIMSKGIKSIFCTYSSKADNDVIRPENQSAYYKFNRFGELTFEYKTYYGDTVYTLYVYDERSNLIIKSSADKYGFFSIHHTYDASNRITSTQHRAQSFTNQDKTNYIPPEETVNFKEKYTYTELSDTSYIKHYHNSANEIYKNEYYYLDHKKRITKTESYPKLGSGKETTEIDYNNENQILSRASQSSYMGNYASKYTYAYDENKNIYSMNYYEGDVFKTEFQFVYDSETNLLTGIISRDKGSNSMMIIQFDVGSWY